MKDHSNSSTGLGARRKEFHVYICFGEGMKFAFILIHDTSVFHRPKEMLLDQPELIYRHKLSYEVLKLTDNMTL